MLDYRGWLIIPTTLAKGQSFINSVTLYAYDAAHVMNDDNFATMLRRYATISSC